MILRMNRDRVIATLRAHEAELKAAGVVRLGLFGSVARGEGGNDVDLVAEFSRALSLIDLIGLENRLSDLLGCKVDLAMERNLGPRAGRYWAGGHFCLLTTRSSVSPTFWRASHIETFL
jgi:uncharacterized protein